MSFEIYTQEVERRRLASLSDYELLGEFVATIGDAHNSIGLSPQERSDDLYVPVHATTYNLSDTPGNATAHSLIVDGDVLTSKYSFAQGIELGAVATYIRMQPQDQTASAHTIEVGFFPQDQVDHLRIDEFAPKVIPSQTYTRITGHEEALSLYVLRGGKIPGHYGYIAPGALHAKVLPDTTASFEFTDNKESTIGYTKMKLARITLQNIGAIAPTNGYLKVEDGRIYKSENEEPIALPCAVIKESMHIPADTVRLDTQDPARGILPVDNRGSGHTRNVLNLQGMLTAVEYHQYIAGEIGWTDITEQFFNSNSYFNNFRAHLPEYNLNGQVRQQIEEQFDHSLLTIAEGADKAAQYLAKVLSSIAEEQTEFDTDTE